MSAHLAGSSPPPELALGEGVEINDLTDREAMGLPARFVERIPPDLLARSGFLGQLDTDTLMRRLQDSDAPFEDRLAAGRIVGLIGDPRIAGPLPRLVRVPGGRVGIGSDLSDVDRVLAEWARVGVRAEWIQKECPRHHREIPTIDVMRYPVTNSEYRHFLLDSGHTRLPTSWRFGAFPTERANEPVWTVAPSDAETYATWLSERTGRQFRLLTEAEWEHAAGGPDGREFPWGNEFRPDRANTVEDGPLTTTPVGCYPLGRSPFGLDDMAGNVEEWVADTYRPYPGGHPVLDDLLAIGPAYRVARGGSFARFGDLARCRRRHGDFARDIYAIGFRLASPGH